MNNENHEKAMMIISSLRLTNEGLVGMHTRAVEALDVARADSAAARELATTAAATVGCLRSAMLEAAGEIVRAVDDCDQSRAFEVAIRLRELAGSSPTERDQVGVLRDEVDRLRDACAALRRDRNELAAALAFVRLDVDTLKLSERQIAARGRLALVDGLRALLAETQAELVTARAMTSPR